MRGGAPFELSDSSTVRWRRSAGGWSTGLFAAGQLQAPAGDAGVGAEHALRVRPQV
ncbi:MAG: hypothetical protein IPL58_15665 [Betaproteobacteria bacterium]|uniref:Uncharacterized protein n=1 Tax=Candidatus Proximibacter danicus TaxID=2954365 RepID=A0A9D7PT71_9PROT|nr:hypothetical protein [Candidatus Proximibacter danicus]